MNRLGKWLTDCLKGGWKASQESGLFMFMVPCGPESVCAFGKSLPLCFSFSSYKIRIQE